MFELRTPVTLSQAVRIDRNGTVPNEAAHVRSLVAERLDSERNLTLTFDGNSNRQMQSMYLMHVTTKDRVSSFVDGHEGSDEHHTGKWVKEKILKVRLHTYWLGSTLIHPLDRQGGW